MDHTNIIETLKERLDSDAGSCLRFTEDSHIYKMLIANLPQRFPRPTNVCTKSSGLSVFDVTFAYKMGSNEKAEPLKMLLSMLLGVREWIGTLDKDDSRLFCLSTILDLDEIKLQLVIEADIEDYYYKPLEDQGSTTTGTVELKKFIPFDINREYVAPEVFYDVQLETGLSTPLLEWWTGVLKRTIDNIDPITPVPFGLYGTFGSDHDLDFVYDTDGLGVLRELFDKLYGDIKWYFYWLKAPALGRLVGNITVKCKDTDVRIQVILNNPRLDIEILMFEEDTEQHIKYKAMRDSDKGSLEFLSETYNESD